MKNTPCLRCNPVAGAYTWCTTCIDIMSEESANLARITRGWAWFTFGVGAPKVNYWYVIFAPSAAAAIAHMRKRVAPKSFKLYPQHPNPDTSCVLAERVAIPDNDWRV